MKLLPTRDNIIVRPVEAETVTQGGIHLPQNAKKAAVIEGTVCAIGPLVKTVKVGWTIFFDKHSPTIRHTRFETDSGEVKLLIMKEEDAMGYYQNGKD